MTGEIEQLRAYSARWGGDFRLAQGAGGNTSLKRGGRMWVKASGFRLDAAADTDIFVEVGHEDALAMADGAQAPASADGRRASIETSLHAVIPRKVVAHLHMIPLIALAVRADAEAALAERLAGLDWAFVPYTKPGMAIAQAVRAIVAERSNVDVVVLGNHGVVFAGEDFAKVDAMVGEVFRRVEAAPRALGQPDFERLARLAERFGLEPARLPAAHQAALDPSALGFATTGTLYPDHVVFLGRGAGRLDEGDDPEASESLLHLVPGAGALLAPGLSDGAHEMAACLAEVAIRIAPDASLRTLSRQEEDALIDWDAEIYRRGLAQSTR